jgi:hypothetical protein
VNFKKIELKMDTNLKILSAAVFGIFAFLIIFVVTNNNLTKESENMNSAQLSSNEANVAANYANQPPAKPVVKVFFENSVSMDGYVDGHTRLKDALFDLFTNVQQIADTIELNYLNTIGIPRNEGLRDFVYNLHRDRFRVAGGNRGQTDMTRIFELVLEEKSCEDVVIMISDCILSPGKGDDAAIFLNKHMIELRRIFSEHLKTLDYNTLALKLNTDFKGIYYNQVEGRTTIQNEERPYFIWIFGHETYMAEMQRLIVGTSLIQRDLTHSHYYCLWNQAQLNYQNIAKSKNQQLHIEPQ